MDKSRSLITFPREMSERDLEPVTPDPKKLYKTAFILLLVMIFGGVFILKAYEKRAVEEAKNDRPSFVTQISEQKDLMFMQQDGKLTDLLSLKGKVLVVQCLPKSQEDSLTSEVMTRLAEKMKDQKDFALVTLMLDPGDADALKDELQAFSEKIGASLPQWTVASNDRKTLHKFIKNEFKANMLPYEEDGKWHYDRSLVLIDKNRHVRRAVIPQKRGGAAYVATFDFDQAQKWDEEGIKTGAERSNLEQLEILLGQTIDILLKENITP